MEKYLDMSEAMAGYKIYMNKLKRGDRAFEAVMNVEFDEGEIYWHFCQMSGFQNYGRNARRT